MAIATDSMRDGTSVREYRGGFVTGLKLFARLQVPVFVVGLGIGAVPITQAAEQGTTTGVASFQAKGEAKNHKPGVTIWTGTFLGVSVMDARKGPLHNAGWDCTGEVVLQDGNSL